MKRSPSFLVWGLGIDLLHASYLVSLRWLESHSRLLFPHLLCTFLTCYYFWVSHSRCPSFPLKILPIHMNSIKKKKEGVFVEAAAGASTQTRGSSLAGEFHYECIKGWKALLGVWVGLLRVWEGKAISLLHAQKRILQCLSTQVLSNRQFAKMALIMLCSHDRDFFSPSLSKKMKNPYCLSVQF